MPRVFLGLGSNVDAETNLRLAIRELRERFGDHGWIFVPNTLHLGTLFVSEDLAETLSAHPRCEVERDPTSLAFDPTGKHTLDFRQT